MSVAVYLRRREIAKIGAARFLLQEFAEGNAEEVGPEDDGQNGFA